MGDEQQISFTEEAAATKFAGQAPKHSFFVRLALGTGLAQDENQASYVLLGFAVLIIVVAAGILIFLQPHPLPALTPDNPAWPAILNHA